MKSQNVKIMGAVLGVIGFLTVTTNSFAACTPVHKFETINTGTLSVTTTSYPPFDNVDASGKFVGVDAEILEKVAERECVKISPTLVDASASIQYVVTGRADMSSGSWYRTAARANVMGVSTPLYLEQMGVYSKQGYSKLAELTGKTVGTVQGYLWVADLKKILGENLKLYPTAVALAQDLEAGRIDTAINTYNAGVDAQRKGGFKGFKVVALQPDSRVAPSVHPAQISFLYAKSNNELGKAINEDIDEMQRKGEIAAILKNYGFDPKSASTGAPRFADVQ